MLTGEGWEARDTLSPLGLNGTKWQGYLSVLAQTRKAEVDWSIQDWVRQEGEGNEDMGYSTEAESLSSSPV